MNCGLIGSVRRRKDECRTSGGICHSNECYLQDDHVLTTDHTINNTQVPVFKYGRQFVRR